jgi:hypothetical protein
MRATLSVLLLLTVAACQYDPMDKPGTWSLPPSGMTSNDTNLRTMLVNPNDAVAGTGEDTSMGSLSERPVEMLVTGRRRPLPSVNASEVGTTGQQQQQQQQQPGMAGAAGGAGLQQ